MDRHTEGRARSDNAAAAAAATNSSDDKETPGRAGELRCRGAAAALGRGTSHGIARYLARALRSAFPAGASLTPSTASSAMENTATTCDRRCANLSRRQHLRNAPAVWNSLPKTVLSSDSVAVYKSRLKAFLFPRLSLLSLLTNALPGPSAS